ncbi:unnamed protein product [Camellia sinensis]
MIDNLWETDDWKQKSENAMKARGCVKYNHTSDLRSFASRASIIVIMVSKIAEQSQPSVTHPLSEEQISREVLGKRSVYLKGYGIRKDNTSSSTHFEAPNSEVIVLQQQLVDQRQQLADQGKQLLDQAQNMSTMQTIIQMLAAKNGIDLANIPGLVRSTNVEEDASGVREDETSLECNWVRRLGPTKLAIGLLTPSLWLCRTFEDVVALVVLISHADQINDLLFGHESALKGLRKDAVIILHSTILPAHIQKVEKRLTAEDLERVFVADIYVSKGMSEVLNGKIMVKIKMVIELLEGIHFVSFVEAISLGAQAGIHPWIIYDIISNAAGNS